ncbi:8579_t:CDS:10 [Paraglomus occultum]|uniref:8579_t:CDS:1 n=1 Tax=Paraglomus occultum TaxID=144539 RepID=A0A9N8W408_9GLOM|nr:8579_t:CDS:10 [Paraglomus occultum]
MDVLKNNFTELLPTIKQAIDEADFIALDTELTGLSERIGRNRSFDSPQARYAKVRAAATKFLIIQFGLCTFTYSSTDDKFIARPFNFYIFPANADRRDTDDVVFMCSGSSLHFLSNNCFDFNKLIANGIPFLNKPDEEILLRRRAHAAQRQIENPPEADVVEAAEKAIKSIEAWLQNPVNNQLIIETPTIRHKRFIFQQVRAKFNGFVDGDSRPKSIAFMRLTEEQRERKFKEDDALLSDINVNFRDVIEMLVEAKKPIIGHNCFLDLCQTIHQFYEEVPEKVRQFKALAHKLFETIIDTKHLASSHSKLQAHLIKTSVQDTLEIVQKRPFTDLGPKIVLDPKFAKYKFNDSSLYHEAGYDAYVTGFIFARLVAFMLHENEEAKRNAYSFLDDVPEGDIPVHKKADDEPVEEQDENDMDSEKKRLVDLMWTSPKVIGYYNKLHMMRSDFKYLNLTGEDGCPSPKPNSFLLSNIPQNCYQSTLSTIFEDFAPIFVNWVDDSNCWLTVKHDKKCEKLKEAKVSELKFFQEFMEGNKRAKKAQENGVTAEMGEITIIPWGDWIRNIVWEDVDQKQAERESGDGEEESGEGSETISNVSSTKSEQERRYSAASSSSIKSLLSNLDNMEWPPPADRLPFPTKDGEATRSVEVNSYAVETWGQVGIEGNDNANNDNVSNEANHATSPITLDSASQSKRRIDDEVSGSDANVCEKSDNESAKKSRTS